MDDSTIVSLYWDRNEQAIAESEEKYGEYCYRIAFYILNEKMTPMKASMIPGLLRGTVCRRIDHQF